MWHWQRENQERIRECIAFPTSDLINWSAIMLLNLSMRPLRPCPFYAFISAHCSTLLPLLRATTLPCFKDCCHIVKVLSPLFIINFLSPDFLADQHFEIPYLHSIKFNICILYSNNLRL